MAATPDNSDNGYYLNIEGYYDKIHRTTWARRTSGMLAGATLGAAYGAAIGVVAAFVPAILHALGIPGAEAAPPGLPSLGTIGSSAALLAAGSAGIGLAITAEVASNSASSAVGMEEKERRELEREKVRELHHSKPLEDVCVDCAVEEAVIKEEIKRDKSDRKGPPIFSWKVASVTVPLFAAFGALIALNSFTASTLFNHAPGFAGLSGGAAVAGSATVFGMFGSLMGMKSSLLTNKLANFYYDVVTERIFSKEPQKALSETPEVKAVASKAVETLAREAEEPATERKTFASDRLRVTLEHLLEKQDKREQQTLLSR